MKGETRRTRPDKLRHQKQNGANTCEKARRRYKKEAEKKRQKPKKDKPCRLYTAARTIAWRQSRVLLGTLADVLKSVRMDGNTVARPSALIWREDSGLSHLVATRMVGRLELCRAAVVFPHNRLVRNRAQWSYAGNTQKHKSKQIKRGNSSTCAAASFRGKQGAQNDAQGGPAPALHKGAQAIGVDKGTGGALHKNRETEGQETRNEWGKKKWTYTAWVGAPGCCPCSLHHRASMRRQCEARCDR